MICYSHQKTKKYLIKDENCPQEKLWAHEVENTILNYLFSLKEDDNGDDLDENTLIIETNVLKELEEGRELLQKKIKRLYNLYAESDDDILLDTINEQKKKLADTEKKIEVEKLKVEDSSRKMETAKLVTNLSETWDYMDIEEQQKTLRMIINKITITDNNINVDFK